MGGVGVLLQLDKDLVERGGPENACEKV
jgi:hypothetical protein